MSWKWIRLLQSVRDKPSRECWTWDGKASTNMPNNAGNDSKFMPLYPLAYEKTVRRALSEDLGRGGDLTTDAIVPFEETATALIIARAPGRVAGIDVAGYVFQCLDSELRFEAKLRD